MGVERHSARVTYIASIYWLQGYSAPDMAIILNAWFSTHGYRRTTPDAIRSKMNRLWSRSKMTVGERADAIADPRKDPKDGGFFKDKTDWRIKV